MIAGAQHFVVFGLFLSDHCFHGQIGEKWVPAAEDEGLPEATDTTVAIGEGVDELEFIVKDAACDERVGIGVFQPVEQVFHEAVDLFRVWREVH